MFFVVTVYFLCRSSKLGPLTLRQNNSTVTFPSRSDDPVGRPSRTTRQVPKGPGRGQTVGTPMTGTTEFITTLIRSKIPTDPNGPVLSFRSVKVIEHLKYWK